MEVPRRNNSDRCYLIGGGVSDPGDIMGSGSLQISCKISYQENRETQLCPSDGEAGLILEDGGDDGVPATEIELGPVAVYLPVQDLEDALTGLGVPEQFLGELCGEILGKVFHGVSHRDKTQRCLRFDFAIFRHILVSLYDDDEVVAYMMERERRDLEQNNYGMKPTAEKAVIELKGVRLDHHQFQGNSRRGAEEEEEEEVIGCSICLESLVDTASAMPCNHLFHTDCISKWLQTSHYCPICRFEMPTD
ncbi:hypothetical protein Tsubulata_050266 [Turnera subulata]|uniref:RING-type E3 ubiquitin transferase n=1 Tax=Turnera subulata TaxID=218843 RepID=A0A9Q0GII7_9ROSI|nr:hypothetical protein Tsubulata_050266 [Turnera subulata]